MEAAWRMTDKWERELNEKIKCWNKSLQWSRMWTKCDTQIQYLDSNALCVLIKWQVQTKWDEKALRWSLVWSLIWEITGRYKKPCSGCSLPCKQVISSTGAHRPEPGQDWCRKATYSRFELFQYTACRLLALERCKFVSASVMRLRENVARAIIPPVLFQPWFPLLLSCVPGGASRRSQHPSGQKTHTQKNAFLRSQSPNQLVGSGRYLSDYVFFNSNPIATRPI